MNTVADLIVELQKLDQSLPVRIAHEGRLYTLLPFKIRRCRVWHSDRKSAEPSEFYVDENENENPAPAGFVFEYDDVIALK